MVVADVVAVPDGVVAVFTTFVTPSAISRAARLLLFSSAPTSVRAVFSSSCFDLAHENRLYFGENIANTSS